MTSMRKTLICKLCMQKRGQISLSSFIKSELCEVCQNSLIVNFYTRRIEGYEAVSIYQYDEFFKSFLYQFKAKGDIELANIFLNNYKLYFKLKYFGYLIVYAPSSVESDEKRGFNHVREIFKCLLLKEGAKVEKIFDFKQSELNYIERQTIASRLRLIDGSMLTGKKVLIVDDLFTTGATIRAIIALIKPYQPKKVKVLTISHTVLDKNHIEFEKGL